MKRLSDLTRLADLPKRRTPDERLRRRRMRAAIESIRWHGLAGARKQGLLPSERIMARIEQDHEYGPQLRLLARLPGLLLLAERCGPLPLRCRGGRPKILPAPVVDEATAARRVVWRDRQREYRARHLTPPAPGA